MVKIVFLLIVCGIITNSLSQEIISPNHPEGTFPYQFENHNLQSNGYYFLTTAKLLSTPQSPGYIRPYPSIIDQNGYLVWYAKPNVLNLSDFKYNDQNNSYSFIKVEFNAGVQLRSYVSMDDQFNLIESFNAIDYNEDTHELSVAQNGNWLYLVEIIDTVDLSSEFFNGQPGSSQTILKGISLQEQAPNGTVVFEWNPNDYINPTDSYSSTYGYNPNSFDYCHTNAIAEDTDGNLLLSMRHLNAIYKIHRQTGAVIWVLGGVSSDFSFTNDEGFSGQHNIRVLGEHHYSMFDNSNMGNPQLSRGLEFMVDTTNWTATVVNEFIHPQNNYARAMGSTHITPMEDVIVGYGLSFLPAPLMAHFDTQNNLLAELHFQDSVLSYRVNYSPTLTNIERPEITCFYNGTSWELIAPSGHSSYWWSNGETTQNVLITEDETLQVFVPQGIGYISSEPMIVSPSFNPCTLNINETSLNKGQGNYNWYSVLGQKLESPKSNSLNLKVWENGVIERIFITD